MMIQLIKLSFVFLLTASLQARPQDPSCPNNFVDLEELVAVYAREASDLWKTNPQESSAVRRLSSDLKGILISIGYGARSDLGESEFISYAVLTEKELRETQEMIQSLIQRSETRAKSQKTIEVLKAVSARIPHLNLLGHETDLEKLKCLGGLEYSRFIEEMLYRGDSNYSELDIKDYKKHDDAEWVQAIDNLIKDESELWHDTIFEGEVGPNGPAHSRLVSVVSYKGRVVLTKVYIEAEGMFFGNGECEFSDDNQEWVGEECAPVTISVTKSLDFLNQQIGDLEFAEFD